MSDPDHKPVNPAEFFDPTLCPIRQVMGNIGDKWSFLVLLELEAGERRYGELQRNIPDISHKVLTATLRKLERDGFVLREDSHTFPPKVAYSLAPLGRELLVPLITLANWGADNLARVQAARKSFDGSGTE